MIFSTVPGLVVFGFFLFFNVVVSGLEDRALPPQSNSSTEFNVGVRRKGSSQNRLLSYHKSGSRCRTADGQSPARISMPTSYLLIDFFMAFAGGVTENLTPKL
jgi:hypothetical protein